MKKRFSFVCLFLNPLMIVIILVGVFFVFSQISFAAPDQDNQPLEMYFLNVGYADSALIKCPSGKWIMIDAASADTFQKIQSVLDQHHVKQLDWVFITHPHENHYAGLPHLLKKLTVKKVGINGDPNQPHSFQRLLQQLLERSSDVGVFMKDDQIEVCPEGVNIKALHPADYQAGVNASSLVLELDYKSFKAVFFGDIGTKQQESILAEYPSIKNASVITVAHHGRDISQAFIETLFNKIFIVSTGYYRKIPLDVKSLRKLDGDVFRTDRGDIVITTDGINVEARQTD